MLYEVITGVLIIGVNEVELFLPYEFRKTGTQQLLGKGQRLFAFEYLPAQRRDVTVNTGTYHGVRFKVKVRTVGIEHAFQIAPHAPQRLKGQLFDFDIV